jgi:hypothetical protein
MTAAQICMWVNGERLACKPLPDLAVRTVIPEAVRMKLSVLAAVKDTWKHYQIAIVFPSKLNCHVN